MTNLLRRLLRRARRVMNRGSKPSSYALPMTYPNVVKLMYFERMLGTVRDLEGDVVECGVGHGKSLFMLACLLKEERKNRKLWGFDSFQGFPTPSPQDASLRNPKKGEWGDTSLELINELISSGKLDQAFILSNLSLIPGFFSESLSKYRGAGIALLHIDADLYASYIDVLRELYPKVIPGGMVILDEYLGVEHLKYPGPYQAIEAFFEGKGPTIQRDAPTGKFYFIKPAVAT